MRNRPGSPAHTGEGLHPYAHGDQRSGLKKSEHLRPDPRRDFSFYREKQNQKREIQLRPLTILKVFSNHHQDLKENHVFLSFSRILVVISFFKNKILKLCVICTRFSVFCRLPITTRILCRFCHVFEASGQNTKIQRNVQRSQLESPFVFLFGSRQGSKTTEFDQRSQLCLAFWEQFSQLKNRIIAETCADFQEFGK